MLPPKKIKMVEGTQSNREPFVTEQIHLKRLCLWGWNLHRDLGEVRVSPGGKLGGKSSDECASYTTLGKVITSVNLRFHGLK